MNRCAGRTSTMVVSLAAVCCLLVAMFGTARYSGAESAYAGIWRHGSGEQRWVAGLSANDFKAQDGDYFDKGLRLIALDLRDGKYSAVWQPGSGTQWWKTGMSADAFKAQDKTYFNQGLRIFALDIDGGKYAAVWRPGTGTQYWISGVDSSKFGSQDKTYFDQGLRLTILRVRDGEYTGVWRPGTGTQWWRSGMTFDEFKAQDKTYYDQGLRISSLDISEGKYTAVWRPGTGTQWWWTGLCFSDFKTEDQSYFDDGLRLTGLVVHSQPDAIYRLPFDNDSGWTLANGNWDDPIAGHSKGDPNGLQSYAFDFLFDSNHDGKGEEGRKVRAARGGTVYTLVKSETKNSYNSNNLCRDGVGNYIVIDHGDGTFGTYWHLQKDGVLVKKGDKVKRGDIIGISGNTGTSSTPHLHFDVRTGWNLNYSKCNITGNELPSVRILFQDNNHDCWIPRVGDSLHSNNK